MVVTQMNWQHAVQQVCATGQYGNDAYKLWEDSSQGTAFWTQQNSLCTSRPVWDKNDLVPEQVMMSHQKVDEVSVPMGMYQ